MSDFGRINGPDVDRYITGNYGEDQLRGDEDDADECDECDECGPVCKGHRPPPPPPTNEQQAMYHLDVARRAADGDNDLNPAQQGRAIANALVGIGYLLAAIKEGGIAVRGDGDGLPLYISKQ